MWRGSDDEERCVVAYIPAKRRIQSVGDLIGGGAGQRTEQALNRGVVYLAPSRYRFEQAVGEHHHDVTGMQLHADVLELRLGLPSDEGSGLPDRLEGAVGAKE